MSYRTVLRLSALLLVASLVQAKDGIVAIIDSEEGVGDTVHVVWRLVDPKSGHPFPNAEGVFIRAFNSAGESTEAFSRTIGRGGYRASLAMPADEIERYEFGIAGEMTHPDGHTERSDWMIPMVSHD